MLDAGSCNNIVFVSLETRVWQLICIPIGHIFFFLSKRKWTSRNFYRLLVRWTETNRILAREINFQHDIHIVFKICLFPFDYIDCSVTVEIVWDRIGSRDPRSFFEKFRAISRRYAVLNSIWKDTKVADAICRLERYMSAVVSRGNGNSPK